MMGDEILKSQCVDIAKSLNGLGLKLTQADGTPANISKILKDVHKLIKSFRVLGKYYYVEHLKKCRELETKNREVETLSRKLQQFQGDSKTGLPIPKPDCQLDAQKRQRREMDTGSDPQAKSVSERQGDLFEGAERNDFQCVKTTAQLERSGEDSTFRTGTPIQNETGKGKERMDCPAEENRPPSRVQFKDQKHFEDWSRLEPDPRGFSNFKDSSSHSEFDDERRNIDQVSETMRQQLVHEQSTIDNLCTLMKDYQDVFFEKPTRAADFKNVTYSSPQTLRGDQVSLQRTTLPRPDLFFAYRRPFVRTGSQTCSTFARVLEYADSPHSRLKSRSVYKYERFQSPPSGSCI